MPPSRRRLVPRRRRADEGEEEGSVVGDIEDDSLSEGSAVSVNEEDGDAEASDASVEEGRPTAVASEAQSPHVPSQQAVAQRAASSTAMDTTQSLPALATSTDNDAMLTGLTSPKREDGFEEVHFNGAGPDNAEATTSEPQASEPQTNVPKAPRNETLVERSRREHQEYIRQRDSNPAFVPNRGGFFLHDDRSSATSTFNGRPFLRGRGRGVEPVLHGPRFPLSEPIEKQWSHDLHDKHESTEAQSPKAPVVSAPWQPKPLPALPTPTAPNRIFSFSTVLGNVAVNVLLPGISKKVLSNVVKKNHTLLPQHRPPLRRDKPVRISIPDEHPRYIFPSTERSFIFIPRALRPNQQSYFRGRGRGSFHGSRRTSVFGGSTYTPSVAMSRKSSFGGVVRDNVRSPAGSISRAMMMGMEPTRPIVRLPSAGVMQAPIPLQVMPGAPQMPDAMVQMYGDMVYGFHSTSLPMHQPRPQKAVSVADIESPASLSLKGPQQQQEQPFHQQMPAYVGSPVEHYASAQVHATGSHGTPLSHIPESAIFAQAFQPMPFIQPQMLYGAPYGNPAMFYPPMTNSMQYGAPMPGMPMLPAFASSAMYPSPQQPPQLHQSQQPSTGTESNGTMYYYDPSQFTDGGQQQQFPMMPMVNPQASYYYPQGPNGVYYGAQPT